MFLSLISRRFRSLTALLALGAFVGATAAPLEAKSCRRLSQIGAGGCQARFDGVLAEDPDCDFSPVDCNNDGVRDLNVPFSAPGSAVKLSFEGLCPGSGVGSVRIRYESHTPGTRWIARDGAGNEVDDKQVPSTGNPQWVELDGGGDCIESIEVHAQETCILGICWKCKADVDVEPAGGFEIALDEDGNPVQVPVPENPAAWDVVLDADTRYDFGLRGWEVAALVNREVSSADLQGTDAEAAAAGGFQSTRVRQINGGGLHTLQERWIPGIGSSGEDGVNWPTRIGSSGEDGVSQELGDGGGAGTEAGDTPLYLVTSAVTLPTDPNSVTLPTEGSVSILRLRIDPENVPAGDDLLIQLIDREDGVLGEDGEPVSTHITVGDETVSTSTGGIAARLGPAAVLFRRGDVNGSGDFEMADALGVLGYLFLGKEVPGCLDAADTNDDGSLDMADSLRLLNWQFLGHNPPAAPFNRCGPDPSSDELDCGEFAGCER